VRKYFIHVNIFFKYLSTRNINFKKKTCKAQRSHSSDFLLITPFEDFPACIRVDGVACVVVFEEVLSAPFLNNKAKGILGYLEGMRSIIEPSNG
jgi:hypothetical protein